MALDRGKADPPPADLAARSIPLRDDLAARDWFRIGLAVHDPLYYSTSDGWRFSSPAMPGTLYLGDAAETCFWEVFWDDLVSRAPAERRLDERKVRDRTLWEMPLPRQVRVVDTTSAAVLRTIGAHGGTFGGPYEMCQRWAAALRAHPSAPDGILYESARDKPHLCLALFAERTAHDAWAASGPGIPLVESTVLAAVLRSNGLTTLRS